MLAVDLGAAGAELAVGCTYKFLNGGPGSPAFSYVARSLQATLPQPIWGWFAQADQFDMGPTFAPQPDIRRLLLGTPSILALAAAEEGIARRPSRPGSRRSPRRPSASPGSASSCATSSGWCRPRRATRSVAAATSPCTIPMPGVWSTALAERRVITDFREPDIVRIGCSPLTTRFTDVCDGLTLLAELISDEHA